MEFDVCPSGRPFRRCRSFAHAVAFRARHRGLVAGCAHVSRALDRVLEDRVVDMDEEEALLTAVERLGLSRGQVVAARVTYLQHLTAQALADGYVSERERAEV